MAHGRILASRAAPPPSRGPGRRHRARARRAARARTAAPAAAGAARRGRARRCAVAVEQEIEVDRRAAPSAALRGRARARARSRAGGRAARAASRSVSSAAAAFRNRGWSARPDGSVSRIVETRRRRSGSREQLGRVRGSPARGRRGSRRGRRRRGRHGRSAVTAAKSRSIPAGRTSGLRTRTRTLSGANCSTSASAIAAASASSSAKRPSATRAHASRRPRGSRRRPRCGRSRRARRPRAPRRRRSAARARARPRHAVVAEQLEAAQLDLHPATASATRSASTCSRTSCTRKIDAPRSNAATAAPTDAAVVPVVAVGIAEDAGRACSCATGPTSDRPADRDQLVQAPHQLDVVLDRLAEADAGIEADRAPRGIPGRHGEREPLLEKRLDLGHDVVVDRIRLHRPRLATHVHQADVGARVGDHAGQLGIAPQRRHVVDEHDAERERPPRHLCLRGVDRDRQSREPFEHGHDATRAPRRPRPRPSPGRVDSPPTSTIAAPVVQHAAARPRPRRRGRGARRRRRTSRA